MEKLDGKTKDILTENIAKLKELFPEVFTEGKVDGEKLKTIMGDVLENSEERYSFNWKGKRDAMRLAMSQSTGTLRPAKDESKNWDTTENLYIEGDNLEVLRLLQESYRGKVKMIYIDPPYNTGKDFVYTDNFHDNVSAYKEKCGEMLKVNPDTNGRYHTNWLNMMYPRLRLAKNLLKDDGVIFISIDDHEVTNLKKACDEIFGEDFVEEYIWSLSDFEESSFTKTASNTVRREHEYIIACFKSEVSLGRYTEFRFSDREDFLNPDNDTRGEWMSGNISRNGITSTSGSKYFTITTPTGQEYTRNWTLSQEEFADLLADNRIFFSRNGDGVPRIKIFKNESSRSIQSSILSGLKTSITGKNEIKELFDDKILFDFPKPTTLIKRFIEIASDQSDIICDFFAGSGTTAHAVMQLNAEDGGSRKWICVQVPEGTGDDSEACKGGYKTISALSMERIRRAGEKIKKDFGDKLKEREKPLDVGFKVLKLDSTNFTAWDEKTGDVQKSLTGAIQSLKADRTNEDAVYEVLIKYGVDLTVPIEEITVEGKKVYSVAGNYLLVCLEDKLTLPVIEALANMKPTRVVFRDAGFADDAVKVNAEQTLKKQGVEDIRVI